MTERHNNQAGWSQRWPAPAKLNLMLRIVGRREDGYHLLQTVFQIIDLCDWLTFTPLQEDRVALEQPIPGVAEQEDLTVRAANLLKKETGFRGGVRIAMQKNLPMGGGLGGGSSDAATTLLVLNALWNLGLAQPHLMKLGVQLGADVPVFIYGHSAWAEGVGEFLQIMTLPEQWFVIIKPECHVATQAIFSAENLTRNSKPIRIGNFIAGDWRNDCLDVVRAHYRPVDEALRALDRYGKALLTGTGACVFVQFADKAAAEKARQALGKDWQVYMAKGLAVSPLLQQLNIK